MSVFHTFEVELPSLSAADLTDVEFCIAVTDHIAYTNRTVKDTGNPHAHRLRPQGQIKVGVPGKKTQRHAADRLGSSTSNV